MAIEKNARKRVYGTRINLASASALVASDGFSIASDLIVLNNVDNVDEMVVTLELTMNVAANDNSGCSMYFRALNVDGGTDDDSIPEAEYRHQFVGFFPVLNGITTTQRSTLLLELPHFKEDSEWEVYIENLTGQEIDAGWTVFATPTTDAPVP